MKVIVNIASNWLGRFLFVWGKQNLYVSVTDGHNVSVFIPLLFTECFPWVVYELLNGCIIRQATN